VEKHALKSKSLPRRGAKAIVSAVEESCDRMGISSMTLYQVQHLWYYIGGSTAMVVGMLDIISDDHSRYTGCINMSLSKLAKLQRKLMAQGEFLATNQFEFSLTNHKGLGMIQVCKKLGITLYSHSTNHTREPFYSTKQSNNDRRNQRVPHHTIQINGPKEWH